MRCSHCSSGRMKRAENFGAERLQCGSCGVVTKQAHHSLTGKQQEFINYVGMWSMERIENAWEVTQDLDQNGIGMAIGISRSNVPRLVEPLITAGLVRKKKAHILDENNRVKSHKKWVYYLTPEGRKHVTESQRAESVEAETFEASRSELRTRRRIPFDDLRVGDDVDMNKFARTNAGGALWQATYQALRDEGRSHAQAETFCNTKFFDQYYEYLIEGLRTPMRNLLNRLQKPSLSLTRKQRKSNREARRRFERYFPDKASENFQAHEGGHIDDIFEAPNRYPVRPTRPSEDWPRPTPRPRRPNRRPNPRPRPARRPF